MWTCSELSETSERFKSNIVKKINKLTITFEPGTLVTRRLENLEI